MRNDLSDITLVIDRSGSMQSCQHDAEGGINQFIHEQAAHPGECLLTLVQFDTEYEFVHKGVPIQAVPLFKLVPRGWTALLDAVGRAINETGNRLQAIVEAERPGCVVFVIVTDGEENSSKEFTKTRIKEMIECQQRDYNWKFTFLGANQDAFAEAAGIGIQLDCAAQYSQKNTSAAFAGVSAAVLRSRCSVASGGSGSMGYTDQERKNMA